MATTFSTTHEHMRVHQHASHGAWIFRQGAAGGLVSGIVFALAQMLFAWVLLANAFAPLQLIASIPLAESPESIPVTSALIAGGLFHLMYSIVLGVIIAAIVAKTPALNRTRGRIVLFASLAGTAIWLIGFYLVAPAIGATWFAETNAFVQFLMHTFAFGTVLGFYLDSNPPKDLSV